MEDWLNVAICNLDRYVSGFHGLSEDQIRNFQIKRDHSVRVAENILYLTDSVCLDESNRKMAGLSAVYHDVGRFSQLVEFNSFDDEKSFDHAVRSVKVLQDQPFLESVSEEDRELIFASILNHNKFDVPAKISSRQLLHTRLLRDADKLDIFKVLTDYYAGRNQKPNHTLTWELPASNQVSSEVVKEVLAGRLVSKRSIQNEADVKIMQLSWIFDINFRPSIVRIFQSRYLEKIYEALPKNDTVIEIYRKVKVYGENRLFEPDPVDY